MLGEDQIFARFKGDVEVVKDISEEEREGRRKKKEERKNRKEARKEEGDDKNGVNRGHL